MSQLCLIYRFETFIDHIVTIGIRKETFEVISFEVVLFEVITIYHECSFSFSNCELKTETHHFNFECIPYFTRRINIINKKVFFADNLRGNPSKAQFHQRSTYSFCTRGAQRRKKRWSSHQSFYAFGFYEHKS